MNKNLTTEKVKFDKAISHFGNHFGKVKSKGSCLKTFHRDKGCLYNVTGIDR